MITSSTLRFVPALLLGALVGLPGCIDPKTVGLETDDASGTSGTAGSPDGGSMPETGLEPDTGTVPTSDGPGTEGETLPTSNGTTEGDDCPPIDIASCVECECIDGTWACSEAGCDYDCTDNLCGDPCMECPLGDPFCEAPQYEGTCSADGTCAAGGGVCTESLQPGFESDLVEPVGCIDMMVIARNTAHTEAITVVTTGDLVSMAVAAGGAVFTELSAGDPMLELEALAGIAVTEQDCGDVVVPGIEVHEVWTATSGTVGITLDPIPGGGGQANAIVELTNVVFERTEPGPDPITVPSLVIPEVSVGWFPG